MFTLAWGRIYQVGKSQQNPNPNPNRNPYPYPYLYPNLLERVHCCGLGDHASSPCMCYQVRGGYLGSLTVRMTFYLRRAGLAAKHYEHIGLVWPFTRPPSDHAVKCSDEQGDRSHWISRAS